MNVEAKEYIVKAGSVEIVSQGPTLTRLKIDGKIVNARRVEFIFEVGKMTICRVDVATTTTLMARPDIDADECSIAQT